MYLLRYFVSMNAQKLFSWENLQGLWKIKAFVSIFIDFMFFSLFTYLIKRMLNGISWSFHEIVVASKKELRYECSVANWSNWFKLFETDYLFKPRLSSIDTFLWEIKILLHNNMLWKVKTITCASNSIPGFLARFPLLVEIKCLFKQKP